MRTILTEMMQRGLKRVIITSGLEAASLIRAAGFGKPAAGHGVIFTLHHVRPQPDCPFRPNGHLEITPEFLDLALSTLAADGFEFIALDAVPERLARPGGAPFAAFTLDDGYSNNVTHALPVFEKHRAPFTVFVTAGFSSHTSIIWWELVEALLAGRKSLTFDWGAGPETLPLTSVPAKYRVFNKFCAFIEAKPEAEQVAAIGRFAETLGIDPLSVTRDLVMNRDAVKALAAHPLATIGAHTLTHPALARLSEADAAAEMSRSADWIEDVTGDRPQAIAYPYGFRAAAGPREARLAAMLGFAVGVITDPGLITAGERQDLTALPRVSLNGYYQKRRYLRALASGIPFRLMRRG